MERTYISTNKTIGRLSGFHYATAVSYTLPLFVFRVALCFISYFSSLVFHPNEILKFRARTSGDCQSINRYFERQSKSVSNRTDCRSGVNRRFFVSLIFSRKFNRYRFHGVAYSAFVFFRSFLFFSLLHFV